MTTRLLGGAGRRSNRSEEGSGTSTSTGSKRAPNPPSRHLWVGNLAEGVTEDDVSYQFSRFGELESVAFQFGRSYAFINFKDDGDAIAALTYLQGCSLAGNPLRIEFAKLDKPSSASASERDYVKHHDELRVSSRGSPLSHRDSRIRDDPFRPDKTKTGDKGGEPSEVLWIGFPALLKVDEVILKKAFSPFGDIEKITAFPGRSYAFVRFRSVASALKAKETLQGKLFGNPRVHICFAKNETGGASGVGRAPLSPPFKSRSRSGGSDYFRQDSSLGSFLSSSKNSSQLYPESDYEDSDLYGVDRRSYLHPGEQDTLDNWRSREGLGHAEDIYGDHSPKPESGDRFRSIGRNLLHKETLYEKPWDLPSDDSYYIRETKKLKQDSELADYSYSDISKESHQTGYRTYGQRPVSDRLGDVLPSHAGRTDIWKIPSNDFPPGSGSVIGDERKRFTPEPEQSSLSLWKWEGTIAKGGTPVCRANCFPVGKAMHFMLPEFLDCTARTGLDMLAKHYYQASSVWVVFFVPDDADIEYYNEFMHYLEEKQRAAVAKLDDRTTLFLVPPSDFSETVLKVPGNLSISGVVLRVDNAGANSGALYSTQGRDSDMIIRQRDAASLGKASHSFDTLASYADTRKLGITQAMSPQAFSGLPFGGGRTSDSSLHEETNDYSRHNWNSTNSGGGLDLRRKQLAAEVDWPSYHEQKRPYGSSDSADSVITERHSSSARSVHDKNSQAYDDYQTLWPPSGSTAAMQSQHLQHLGTTHAYELQDNEGRALPSEKTLTMNPSASHSTSGARDDGDAQKCLQATLQLAAALLQQIQQGKGS